MRNYLPALIALASLPAMAGAQEPVVASTAQVAKEEHTKVVKPSPFYDSEQPIEVTFTANIGKIRGDKGEQPPWHMATLSYKDTAGSIVSLPLKARTRGIWRLRMCDFPPLRLNFSGETS